MKKTLLSIFYIIFFANSVFSENKINGIKVPDLKTLFSNNIFPLDIFLFKPIQGLIWLGNVSNVIRTFGGPVKSKRQCHFEGISWASKCSFFFFFFDIFRL